MPKNAKTCPEFTPTALAGRLAASGFRPAPGELAGLFVYMELLQKWNKVMNLVGPYDWTKMADDLILDSLHLAAFIRDLPLPAAPEVWDFGAGAGLPGIPLRIIWQAGNYTMVDSREKRIMFLQNALARLNLPGVRALADRAENFMAKAEPAHLLVSRAFMPWPKLLDLIRGRLAPGGAALFMALEKAPRDLPKNWRVLAETSYEIPAGIRHFWAVSGG